MKSVFESETDEEKGNSGIASPKRFGDYQPLRNMGDRHGSSTQITDFDDDERSSTSGNDIDIHQAASEGSIDQIKRFLNEVKKDDLTKFAAERDRLNVQGASALHLAARYNRKNVVAYLLEIGADKDAVDSEDENTPLLLASKYNMKLTAKLLLESGASATKTNKYGTTALHFAARRGNVELCKSILDLPDVLVNATDNGEATPLHMAMMGRNEDITKLMIKSGADVYAKDKEGERPIHYAAAEDAGDLIVLLANGALEGIPRNEREKKQREFVNVQSDENDTALHVAAQAGYEETVKTLVSIGADCNMKTDTQQTALHLASISGQTAVVQFLIKTARAKVNVRDSELMTPLHRACQFGRLKIIKFLLECGARLDVKDKDNFTPLMCSVWKGQNEVVDYLLGKGALIELTDVNSKTVLHLAIEERHFSTLELLLQKGGVKLMNETDKDYKTPMHHAAFIGDERCVNLLLNNKAVVDVGDHEEKTPLHIAAENGHINCVKCLGKAEAGIINSTDDEGKSPIHLAAMQGHVKVVELLIEMGAETSCRDDNSWTPLDYAAANDFPKTMDMLLDNDALVDATDRNEMSPLHHASAKGHTNCISILLDHGASIILRNNDGKNCLDLAVENYERDACKALISHKRWLEAVKKPDNSGVHPMEKIIQVAPEVAAMVLDRCVEIPANVPKDSSEYYEKYNFELLDIDPDKRNDNSYFGPGTMVLYKRDELLSHPLTVTLINDKWVRYGRWLYFTSLLCYVLFVALLTSILVIEKKHRRDLADEKKLSKTDRCSNISAIGSYVPWLTLAVACFQILKEIVQAIYLGRKYIFDPVNWFEFALYTSTFIFMIPFILCQTGNEVEEYIEDIKWQAGSVSILFAWFNLLLYLKRFPVVGIYVVMFTEIFMTLVKVLLVFSLLIVAFALAFYSLVDVQDNFKMPGRAIVRAGVMMIGELDYDKMFTSNFADPVGNKTNCTDDSPDKNCLPYKPMTMFIFLLFLVIMSIIIMNLLVGLAVGDIESVRKNAYLRILKSHVKILQVLERTYPKILLRKLYADGTTIRYRKRSPYFRFVEWVKKKDAENLKEEQVEMGGKQEKMLREIRAQSKELSKQKEKMKSLITLLEAHARQTQRIARELEIEEIE